MAENKVTLGQLVNVLTESGIDLNEIYLDENQINGMQTSLSEENQKKLVGFVSELMQSVSEEELSKIGGGALDSETKEKLKKGGKIGLSILGGIGILTTVIGTGIELLGRFGSDDAQTKLNGWKPSDLGKNLFRKNNGGSSPTFNKPNGVEINNTIMNSSKIDE